MIEIRLVSSWQTACGIAEHSLNLKTAVEAADPELRIVCDPAWLDPAVAIPAWDHDDTVQVVHLNYHAALHSRWTPETIAQLGYPYLVTFHDTGVPNSDLCKAIVGAATAAVVHEPFDDLPAEKTHYWRMGVPEIDIPPFPIADAAYRPYLGTVGFPFPWKNYDQLCEVTAANGWGLCLIAPGATAEDVQRWTRINPHLFIRNTFRQQAAVQAILRGCDATVFCYVTHNTGQSGAILQGIAAGKPVFAFETCRQFRALRQDPLGHGTIWWGQTFDDLAYWLRDGALRAGRLDGGIVALRTQESWTRLGTRYAALYRSLAGGAHA